MAKKVHNVLNHLHPALSAYGNSWESFTDLVHDMTTCTQFGSRHVQTTQIPFHPFFFFFLDSIGTVTVTFWLEGTSEQVF